MSVDIEDIAHAILKAAEHKPSRDRDAIASYVSMVMGCTFDLALEVFDAMVEMGAIKVSNSRQYRTVPVPGMLDLAALGRLELINEY